MFLVFAINSSNAATLQGAFTDQDAAKKEADRIYGSWQATKANPGSRLVVTEATDLYVVPSDAQAKSGGIAANFTWSPASPKVNQAVSFSDTSTGSPTSWTWDFGDGQTSPTQNPSHPYVAPGAYTVSLTVTGPAGSNRKTQSISVSA